MGDSKEEGSRPLQTKLPPGTVLGPDGKPCKACGALSDMTKAARTHKVASNGAGLAALASIAPAISNVRGHCPPDRDQLGRATWAFLHTTAAYYPDKPTPSQQSNMLSLIRALPVLYPCSHCAEDFGQEIKANPPDVSGRVALSRWFCERHNDINEKLGKAKFDCLKTDERWKDGPSDGSCD
jgi:mitochondrial FAD-linked sulfhydryl oxidase